MKKNEAISILATSARPREPKNRKKYDEAVKMAINALNEPERKKGKWIGKEQFTNSPEFYSWQCSVCGCVLEEPTLDKPYPFCPHCGSQNAEEEGDAE